MKQRSTLSEVLGRVNGVCTAANASNMDQICLVLRSSHALILISVRNYIAKPQRNNRIFWSAREFQAAVLEAEGIDLWLDPYPLNGDMWLYHLFSLKMTLIHLGKLKSPQEEMFRIFRALADFLDFRSLALSYVTTHSVPPSNPMQCGMRRCVVIVVKAFAKRLAGWNT